MEAIIVCGGRGTRLKSVWDLPKCLAPIHGRPFLEYLLFTLSDRGIKRFILATGWRKDLVRNFCKSLRYDIEFSEEDIPIGTGGAVKRALAKASNENVFVINGDTYFHVSLDQMMEFHKEQNALVTSAIKVKSKPFGLVNGGLCVVNKRIAKRLRYHTLFEDVFEKYIPYVYLSHNYFIDIGTPDDYRRAQSEFIKLE